MFLLCTHASSNSLDTLTCVLLLVMCKSGATSPAAFIRWRSSQPRAPGVASTRHYPRNWHSARPCKVKTIILTHSFFPFPSSYSSSSSTSSSFLSFFKSFLPSLDHAQFHFLTFSFYLLFFSRVTEHGASEDAKLTAAKAHRQSWSTPHVPSSAFLLLAPGLATGNGSHMKQEKVLFFGIRKKVFFYFKNILRS